VTNVTDSFNRADSAVSLGTADSGQTWTALTGTWGISSNKAYLVTHVNQDTAYIDNALSDCAVQVTFNPVAANNSRLVFRLTDASNFHFVQSEGGSTYKHYKYESGGFTQLGSYATTPANGDVLKVVLNGSSIDTYLNGTVRISVSNSFNSTATKHGIGGANGTPTAERWEDFSAVATATTYTQSVGGTLTPSGTLVRKPLIVKGGTLNTFGILARKIILAPKGGTLTPSGTLTAARVTLKVIGGTLGLSGALVTRLGRAVGGTLTPSGTVVRQVRRSLIALLTPVGTLSPTHLAFKVLSGALGLVGTLTRALLPSPPTVDLVGEYRIDDDLTAEYRLDDDLQGSY
jgi:hypothetical protein